GGWRRCTRADAGHGPPASRATAATRLGVGHGAAGRADDLLRRDHLWRRIDPRPAAVQAAALHLPGVLTPGAAPREMPFAARAIGSLFARIAAAPNPDRQAVVGADGGLTYAELLDRARRLAARVGAGPSPVLVYGHKQPSVVVGIVSALRLGRPYVPVDPSAPPARISRMLEAARPADAVLAQEPPPALAGELAARGIRTVALDPLAAPLAAAAVPAGEPAAAEPETPAYIVFTSGTTGDPKGVPIPHRALRHFADWLLATHPFVPGGEVFLNQAPLSFDLSVMDLYGALLTGGTFFAIGRAELDDPRPLFRRPHGAPPPPWGSTPSLAP